jgi:MraZ protein
VKKTDVVNKNIKLRGTTTNTVDPKGRFIIPKRFRDYFCDYPGNGDKPLMITYYSGALHVYPEAEWERREAKLLANETMAGQYQHLIDNYLGQVSECRIDKQWRVLVPADLREMAGVREDIVIVGLVYYFKVWDREKYEAQRINFDKQVDSEEYQRVIRDIGL